MAKSTFCFRHTHLTECKGIKIKIEELAIGRYLQVVLVQESGSNENFHNYRKKERHGRRRNYGLWSLCNYWR